MDDHLKVEGVPQYKCGSGQIWHLDLRMLQEAFLYGAVPWSVDTAGRCVPTD